MKRNMRILMVAALLAGCSTAEPSAPVAMRTSVESYTAPILNMTLDAGDARNGMVIAAAGDAALQVGKAMISGKPPVDGEIEAINFTVLGKAKDDTSVGRKIVHFTLTGQELRQLAHAGANGETILDSATEAGSWSPSNNDVLTEYCGSRPNATFCEKAK